MQYYETVAPIVRRAGETVRPYYGDVASLGTKTEGSSDVVTQLDRDVESFLAKELTAAYPGTGFYGEEFGGEVSDRYWLVDPIDGTQHFIRGMPFCSVMVALIEQNAVAFSVIYNFVTDEMFAASRGEGAFCNEQPIVVSERGMAGALCGITVSPDDPRYTHVRKAVRARGTLSFHACSSGFELAMVAAGRLDGRIHIVEHSKTWDHAPGALLVQEAGGIITNIGSDTYDYRDTNYIAGAPAFYHDLVSGDDPILQ